MDTLTLSTHKRNDFVDILRNSRRAHGKKRQPNKHDSLHSYSLSHPHHVFTFHVSLPRSLLLRHINPIPIRRRRIVPVMRNPRQQRSARPIFRRLTRQFKQNALRIIPSLRLVQP